jgi:hypothetical protein
MVSFRVESKTKDNFNLTKKNDVGSTTPVTVHLAKRVGSIPIIFYVEHKIQCIGCCPF